MAPIPEASEWTSEGQQWMAMALGVVATACVSLSIALIVLLCGGGGKKEEAPKEEAPPAAPEGGGDAPAGDAPADAPKEPSNKEAPAPKSQKGGSQKAAPSQVGSAKAPDLKLTSEKPAQSAIGKSAKGGIDLKKQPSLQLQAATAKK